MSPLRSQSPTPAVKSLEARIAELRDELFGVADLARRSVPYDYTAVHVSLQAASNELGEAERALREASRAPAGFSY